MKFLQTLLDRILTSIGVLVNFLFIHFSQIVRRLIVAADNIPMKYLVRDFMSTLASVGMVLVFQILALLIFIMLPQGKDILLIVAEDVGVTHQAGNLIWLTIGLFFWSIVSEYAVRYAIYVTDNSGVNLSEVRVRWRKELQRAMADIFLVLPYFVVLIGLAFNYAGETAMTDEQKNVGFGVTAFLIYIMLNLVSFFYFNKKKRDEWRRQRGGWRSLLLIPEEEIKWCGKLTGIYNDFVFEIRKSSNFANEAKIDMDAFTENFLYLPPLQRNAFPKNYHLVNGPSLVPQSFQLRNYTEDRGKPDGYYRWQYRIPNHFYKTLHNQLFVIVGTCIAIFITVLYLRIDLYSVPGAPGLVMGAFACWTGIYIGILYVDYALMRRGVPLRPGISLESKPEEDTWAKYRWTDKLLGMFSLRSILLFLLIFSSLFNFDHPVRGHKYVYDCADSCKNCFNIVVDTIKVDNKITIKERYYSPVACDNRPDMTAHFKDWLKQHFADPNVKRYAFKNSADTAYPIIFVCAEGGALRTGAYSSMMLGMLQDTLSAQGIDFRKYIYAMSGVSGGSLGISFFNAIAFLDNENNSRQAYREASKKFFAADFLAPVIGKMFYGDVLQLFIPWHIPELDRAIGLEKAWEWGYDIEGIKQRPDYNVYNQSIFKLYRDIPYYPAMFVNTTEVESGLQCWLSNVRPNGLFYANDRDLYTYKVRSQINYSTMVNFSTRFPLFSPGACLIQQEDRKLHYVDGGYVENTGCGTMVEVLRQLKPVFDSLDTTAYAIRPFVILLRFGEESDNYTDINFGNELTEIALGLYNTRGGRVRMATKELNRLMYHPVEGMKGSICNIALEADGSAVPMNWVLSDRSLYNLDSFIRRQWGNRTRNGLNNMFFVNNSIYQPVAKQTLQKLVDTASIAH